MVQTVVGLMLDATVIGVVFQKLANANARANTASWLRQFPSMLRVLTHGLELSLPPSLIPRSLVRLRSISPSLSLSLSLSLSFFPVRLPVWHLCPAQVIFSDTALLEVEDGCAYLRFRVADMSLGFVEFHHMFVTPEAFQGARRKEGKGQATAGRR